MSWVQIAREIVETNTVSEINGAIFDQFSASVMIQVHDALSPANQAKFAAMPVERAQSVAFHAALKASK